MLSDDLTSTSIQLSKEAISVSFKTTEITMETMKNIIEHILNNSKEGNIVRGEQSLQELVKSNQELSSVPITDKDLEAFKQELNKFGVDFSIRKDMSQQDIYKIYFKAQDVNLIRDVLQEHLAVFSGELTKDEQAVEQEVRTEQPTEEKIEEPKAKETSITGEKINEVGKNEKKSILNKLDNAVDQIKSDLKPKDLEAVKDSISKNSLER